jgi:MFS superfamily sulfate permease-like transporter
VPRTSYTFVPKLITALAGYDRKQLLRDLTAGVIVGIVALPLAIAFAIASGVTSSECARCWPSMLQACTR